MTDEELDALVEMLQQRDKSKHGYTGHPLYNRDGLQAADAITTLRAQLADAHKDGFQLAAWQCLFDDSKTGIVCDDWGNQYCAMQRRADRAEAALAAQIDVDAKIAFTAATSSASATQRKRISTAIRNQQHDRTVLDRMLTEAREKALREAAALVASCTWGEYWVFDGEHVEPLHLSDAILAMIDKGESHE